jgi:hypothetical protein
MDCEPHRAALLNFLCNVSVWCGVAALCCLFPSLLGITAGAVACLLARRDLRLMARGLMDPRGEKDTRKAASDGLIGVVVNLAWLVWVLAWYLVITI